MLCRMLQDSIENSIDMIKELVQNAQNVRHSGSVVVVVVCHTLY